METSEVVTRYQLLTPGECGQVIAYAHAKRKELTSAAIDEYYRNSVLKGDPGLEAFHKGEQAYNSSITSQYHYRYNFLKDNPRFIPKFRQAIRTLLPTIEFPIAVQAWVNIYENGEGVILHNHWGMTGQSFSANVFLGGPTAPGVFYSMPNTSSLDRPAFDSVVIENKVGEMHLFDCGVHHMVPARESKETRYTIGMTIHSCWVASTKGVLSTLDEFSRGFDSNQLFLS
jgi:hypothetical protein